MPLLEFRTERYEIQYRFAMVFARRTHYSRKLPELAHMPAVVGRIHCRERHEDPMGPWPLRQSPFSAGSRFSSPFSHLRGNVTGNVRFEWPIRDQRTLVR